MIHSDILVIFCLYDSFSKFGIFFFHNSFPCIGTFSNGDSFLVVVTFGLIDSLTELGIIGQSGSFLYHGTFSNFDSFGAIDTFSHNLIH